MKKSNFNGILNFLEMRRKTVPQNKYFKIYSFYVNESLQYGKAHVILQSILIWTIFHVTHKVKHRMLFLVILRNKIIAEEQIVLPIYGIAISPKEKHLEWFNTLRKAP